MYFMPSEEAIARVQADLGLDRLQAIRHLQQKQWILEQQARGVIKTYQLGKTAELEAA